VKSKAQKSKARESRSIILEAAERLFAQQGFQATTLRQISETSGANGALVSYYFGNKAGLWDAVLEKKLASFEVVLAPITRKAGEVVLEDVQQVVRQLFAHVREDQSFHLLARRAMMEDPSLTKQLAARLWRPFLEQISLLIQRVSAGTLNKFESDVRANVIHGMIQRYSNLRRLYYGDPAEKDQSADMQAAFESYIIDNLLVEICGLKNSAALQSRAGLRPTAKNKTSAVPAAYPTL
jgi:AcrR family transcriptional regulator